MTTTKYTLSHNFPLQLIILVLIATFTSKVCCSSSNNNADSSNKIIDTSDNSYAISATNYKESIQNPYIDEEFVCGDIDIRDSVKQFSQLENCTVVEGYVKIVLIDNGLPEHYENLSFPKLREITDYLLLYRAFGMQSMAKLFPNLAVIRGRKLMYDYAFVVYEMYSLQEIGLHSLTHVLRGDIRIEKNPNLCFIDTIDWSRIAKNYLISENKNTELCPKCPNHCPIVGVKRKSGGMVLGDLNGRDCWTSDVCQKRICPDECERRNATCTDSGECCSDQCIGGCTIISHKPVLNQTCVACKNFVYNHRCYQNCPSNTYEYFGRRCITAEECHNLSIPDLEDPVFYKAFNGKCASSCPVGYHEDPTNKTHCVQCGDICPKECIGGQVSNIASVRLLKNCTVIKGNLEIYLPNCRAQIVKELEENLKYIKEITGYLKIVRSFPIITLDFLRNLEVIGGESLEQNSSFIVLDNPNLQDLWTFDNNTQQQQLKTGKKRIQILKGRIFFYVNPKLCYQKIKKMTDYVNIVTMNNTWELSDVSSSTNGDRVTCDVHKLNVTFFGVVSDVVGVSVENFIPKMKDPRHLLAYLIYYRETENYNVTIFEGRDACSDNGWNVSDIDARVFSNYVVTIIPDLKPDTLYAMYVKTYIIGPDEIGGQSDILYFKTLPSTSSRSRNFRDKVDDEKTNFPLDFIWIS